MHFSFFLICKRNPYVMVQMNCIFEISTAKLQKVTVLMFKFTQVLLWYKSPWVPEQLSRECLTISQNAAYIEADNYNWINMVLLHPTTLKVSFYYLKTDKYCRKTSGNIQVIRKCSFFIHGMPFSDQNFINIMCITKGQQNAWSSSDYFSTETFPLSWVHSSS